jgi:CRISPR-associated protein (TIGR03985 family)
MKSQIALPDIPFQAIPLSIDTLSDVYISEITEPDLRQAIRRLIEVQSIDLLSLKPPFTVPEWQQAFHNNFCNIEGCSWADCPEHKTARQLLSKIYNLSPELLADTIGANSSVTIEEINSALDEKAFFYKGQLIGHKTLNADFKCLASGMRPWLIGEQLKMNPPTYSKGPRFLNGTIQSIQNLSVEEARTLLESLQVLEEHNPELSDIIDKIFPDADILELTPRVLLRIDNITAKEKCDVIEDILKKLYGLWDRSSEFWNRPISFKYKSSSCKQNNPPPCEVYPVCVVFYKRVKYLYAWGLDHKENQNWYAYRLDRIELESLVSLNWTDIHHSELFQKYSKNNLPKPQDVKNELELAWGTDIQEQIETLVLRFDRDYYESYIENTDRGSTAQLFLGGADEAIEFLQNKYIKDQNPDDTTSQNVAKSIARIEMYRNDAYFKVDFRSGDKYTVMQLRSWGAKIEVLAPFDLREKMIEDAKKAIANYGYNVSVNPSTPVQSVAG